MGKRRPLTLSIILTIGVSTFLPSLSNVQWYTNKTGKSNDNGWIEYLTRLKQNISQSYLHKDLKPLLQLTYVNIHCWRRNL